MTHARSRTMVPRTPPDPSRMTEAHEIRALLDVFFLELPDRQRQVFDLVELQGYSAVDAARLMGIEPVSVRAHLFRARRRLRERILRERPEIAEERP